MKKIGERVRVLREIRSLSQENMSEELKMSQQGYSKIERGDKEIKIARLEQIAKILGVKSGRYFNLRRQHAIQYSPQSEQ